MLSNCSKESTAQIGCKIIGTKKSITMNQCWVHLLPTNEKKLKAAAIPRLEMLFEFNIRAKI